MCLVKFKIDLEVDIWQTTINADIQDVAAAQAKADTAVIIVRTLLTRTL